MKTTYLFSFAVATALFTGCGSSSDTTTSDTLSTATTITVQRGPVLGADVIDANGQIATEGVNAEYTFATDPVYPIIATGGVIDIDRDGKVSIGDVVNDINLTTVGGDVITLATTMATNPTTKAHLEAIAADLNITLDDVLTKTPDESTEIEAISNVLYKYVKENNITNLLDTNSSQLQDLNLSAEIKTEYHAYEADDSHDFETTESELIQTLTTTVTSVNRIDNDSEVEEELAKIETELDENELADIKEHLDELKNEYEVEYGDLDYEDEGDDFAHNQGLSCATCHSGTTASFVALSDDGEDDEGGEDAEENEGSENVFDSGATIYTALTAANYDTTKAANNYSLRLVLESGSVVNYRIGQGTGNVNATFNAGITSYTAEVLNAQGEVVNSSATNSHDTARFDCNSCHTAAGTSGAPGRIVSFNYVAPVVVDANVTTVDTNTTVIDTNTTVVDTNTTIPDTNTTTVDTNTTTQPPVATLSFATDVEPILTTLCAGCHGTQGNFSITNNTPYAGTVAFVDTTTPENSQLLQKGAAVVTHGGGNILGGTASADYITIRDWIAEGALDN